MNSENLKSTNVKSEQYKIGLLTLLLIIIGYSVYIISMNAVTSDFANGGLVFILNWVGIFVIIYIIFTWYKISGTLFSPYIIFMTFFFLFNLGQPLMWAFGIHISNEIGQTELFPGFGVPTSGDIIKAQMLIIISILMFHFGAVLSPKKKLRIQLSVNSLPKRKFQRQNTGILKSIFYSSLLLGLIVIPVTLYYSFLDLKIALSYGYKSLYYSEFARTEASFFGLLTRLFFPCLVGLLIGSRFNKKVRVSVYLIFSIYLILNLLSGDRGTWVYKIIILIWLSHTCYKKIDLKKLIKYSLYTIVGLYFIDAIVSVRNIGLGNITFSQFLDAFSFENSLVVSAIFEMGGSMKPTIVLQKYGWDIWSYANTYLLAILGMITNKVIYALDLPFSLISSWFSQEYLGISWGAGFSIVAESLLNFGPYFAPIFMILLGYIISSLLYIDKKANYFENPMRFLFIAATLHALLPLTRNYLHLLLKDWFYGIVPLFLVILFFRMFILKQKGL